MHCVFGSNIGRRLVVGRIPFGSAQWTLPADSLRQVASSPDVCAADSVASEGRTSLVWMPPPPPLATKMTGADPASSGSARERGFHLARGLINQAEQLAVAASRD